MELADMQDLGSCAARRKGSSPLFRMIKAPSSLLGEGAFWHVRPACRLLFDRKILWAGFLLSQFFTPPPEEQVWNNISASRFRARCRAQRCRGRAESLRASGCGLSPSGPVSATPRPVRNNHRSTTPTTRGIPVMSPHPQVLFPVA